MKSISFGVLLLFCLPDFIFAQNLVLNGGFEDNRNFRHSVLVEETLLEWYSYFNTPEYYNTQLTSTAAVLDYCGTLPRTGNGMVGAYQLGYFEGLQGYNRQYFQGTLSQPLKAGQVYYVEFYVKPLLESPIINFAIDNIGAAFTNKRFINQAEAPQFIIPLQPVVEYNDRVIIDRSEWTKVSGCFTAEGGETFIVLGNFRTDEDTKFELLPGAVNEEVLNYGWSFYLFDDVLVEAVPKATIIPNDTIFCKDSSLIISAFHPNAKSYLWSTLETSSSITIKEAGFYSVEITTDDGCKIVQEATFRTIPCVPNCPAILLPNAFTPNGDGLNDVFMIVNNSDIYYSSLSIFNRWGQQIFTSYRNNTGWDGTFKSIAADAGTYFYLIEYLDCQQVKQIKTGDFQLIR